MEPNDSSEESEVSGSWKRAFYSLRHLVGFNKRKGLLNEAVDSLLTITHAERGFLILHDKEESFDVIVTRHAGTEPPRPPEIIFNIVKRVIFNREPVHIADVQNAPSYARAFSTAPEEGGVKSICCIPLTTFDGTVIGAIYLDSRKEIPGYGDKLEMLRTFCEVASQHLMNLQRIKALDDRTHKLEDTCRELISTNEELKHKLLP